jgi:hypothetical protein
MEAMPVEEAESNQDMPPSSRWPLFQGQWWFPTLEVEVKNSVARSQQAFTATPAQNHGHLATFHGHKIVQYGYIHGHFNKENYLIKGTLSRDFWSSD